MCPPIRASCISVLLIADLSVRIRKCFCGEACKAGGGFYGFTLSDGVEDVGENQIAGLD